MFSSEVQICQYLIYQAKVHGIDSVLNELTQAQTQVQDLEDDHLSPAP